VPLVVLTAALAVAVAASVAAGQTHARRAEHWVSTWATSLPLIPPVARPGGAPPRPGGGQPAAPPRPAFRPVPSNIPVTLADQTVRMIVRTSVGGRGVRVSLSNMLNAEPLRIGSAHVAVHAGGGRLKPGTDRELSFAGRGQTVVPPGALLVSDPVDLDVTPLTDLAVSLYLPVDTGVPTSHTLGLRTGYVATGDLTASLAIPDATTTLGYLWLSAIDVLAPADSFTIVALGDSITDGYGTTLDAGQTWPALLADRLASGPRTRHIGVVNQGISGNQLLRNGAGVSGLARFDRDVLSRSGVKWVILLEGINDINIRGRVDGPDALTVEDLIAGYKQIIARAHTHGLKVAGATLTPEEGVPTASERGEAIRQAANRWIRTSGAFDAVIDFDQVLRDPDRPIRLRPEFDPGDHIHPNDAGNRAMAAAFDLRMFLK
jgi:lysophospholipase L1-like esterase